GLVVPGASPIRLKGASGMDDQMESLLGGRCRKVPGDLVELCVRGLEGVLARLIADAQSGLALFVGYVDEVQAMGRASLLEDAACPGAGGWRVGGKVQHHRGACSQQRCDVLLHGAAQPARQPNIVRNGAEFTGIQSRKPRILADED